MATMTYNCRKCKAVNRFNAEPDVRLLYEKKGYPEKQTLEQKGATGRPRVYILTCENCGEINRIEL